MRAADREDNLGRLAKAVFDLADEIAADLRDGRDVAEKTRKLYRLRSEYKNQTGVFPMLPADRAR